MISAISQARPSSPGGRSFSVRRCYWRIIALDGIRDASLWSQRGTSVQCGACAMDGRGDTAMAEPSDPRPPSDSATQAEGVARPERFEPPTSGSEVLLKGVHRLLLGAAPCLHRFRPCCSVRSVGCHPPRLSIWLSRIPDRHNEFRPTVTWTIDQRRHRVAMEHVVRTRLERER